MNTSLYNFLKLGSYNKLRLITAPHQYYCHASWSMNDNGERHAQKLKCPTVGGMMSSTIECSLCLESKAKPRWMIGVINRDDNRFYLIDIGYSLFSLIRDLARDPNMGDPKGYDIEILCLQNDQDEVSPITRVIACVKTPLTEEEEILKGNIDKEYLTNLCNPDNSPQLLERIRDIKHNQDKNV